ncbi:hypothetical protein [Catenulispora subtropica]|uniref:Uncharacterized protein n=1 Tax=Catenulispora subtropica TaxID=450798 RepID=A0ABP5C846_9ACTN
MAKSTSSKNHSPSSRTIDVTMVLMLLAGVIALAVLAAVVWAPMPRAKMVVSLVLGFFGLLAIWLKRGRR